VIEGAKASGARVLAVTGNCDSPAIEERLVRLDVSLHHRGVLLEATGWHGMSAIPHWKSGMHQFTEEELAAALEAGYAQVQGARRHCVLSHVPPHGLSVDEVHSGRHAGSTALRRFVDETGPCLVVCGHIHETRGLERLGPTTVVNCGLGAAGNYALIEADDEVTVDLRCA
jgi:Icc-related predicted phosphoesterase